MKLVHPGPVQRQRQEDRLVEQASLSRSSTSESVCNGPALLDREADPTSLAILPLFNSMLEEDQYKEIVVWGPKGDSFIVKVSQPLA